MVGEGREERKEGEKMAWEEGEGRKLRERVMVAELRLVQLAGTHLLPRHTGEVPQQSAPPVCPLKCANVAPDGV